MVKEWTMMYLFERALAAHARAEKEREIEYVESVKARVKQIEQLVEDTFGVPFGEAFDVSKVAVANEGCTLEVDGHVCLHLSDEGGLEVAVYEPDTRFSFVGRAWFRYIKDPDYQERNLVTLGGLLAKARLAAEDRRARAA